MQGLSRASLHWNKRNHQWFSLSVRGRGRSSALRYRRLCNADCLAVFCYFCLFRILHAAFALEAQHIFRLLVPGFVSSSERSSRSRFTYMALSHLLCLSVSATSISVRPFSISPCPVKSQMGRESGTSSIYLAVDVIRSKFNSLTLSPPLFRRPTNDPFGFVVVVSVRPLS